MNTHLPSLHTRKSVARKFFKLQTEALRDALQAISDDQNTSLPTFPKQAKWSHPKGKFGGVKEIPLEKIVGSFHRNRSFDHKFRPVKRSRQDRWTNTYRTFKKDDLTPIIVHKLADGYYVEDGHQRVSVARSLGQTAIKAQVWEYPAHPEQTNVCLLGQCAERSSAEAYAL